MDADGANKTRLLNTQARDESPAWSPDGTKIAFQSRRKGKWDVYSVHVDGTNQVNLTDNPSDDSLPNWSPDGSKIAFTQDGEIYVMESDGSNQKNLTNDPAWDGGLGGACLVPRRRQDSLRSQRRDICDALRRLRPDSPDP